MGGPRRRWTYPVPRGSAVAHPAVRSLVSRGDPGTRPRRHVIGGTELVAYSSTRVNMKRDAWELLSPSGILVQWIRPKGETPWAIALTHTELFDVFGEITQSGSWEEARCYHFPSVPVAVGSFRVVGMGSEHVLSPSPVDSPLPSPKAMLKAEPPSIVDAPVSVEQAATRVLHHLRAYGSLSEAEVTRIAGGPRAYRKLRRHLHKNGPPLHMEATPSGTLWRLPKGTP